MSLYFSNRNSSISSLTSPWTTISSPPLGVLVTEEPVANFLPNSFATCSTHQHTGTGHGSRTQGVGDGQTFLRSKPKASRPETAVTNFRLFLSILLTVTILFASLSACLASAASALAVFFWASLAARFWASRDSEAVAASRASICRKAGCSVASVFLAKDRHESVGSHLATISSSTSRAGSSLAILGIS